MKISPIDSSSHASIPPTGLLSDLFRGGKCIVVEAKHTLFRAGDPCDGMYRVMNGLLKATVIITPKRERILSIVGSDAVIGEVSALDRGPRSASVVAIRASQLSFVNLQHFNKFSRDNPDVYREIALLLAHRLRNTNSDLAMNALSIKGRAARALLSLAEAYGQDVGAGRILVRQKMSQGELAAMAGIARENLSRILKDWVRNGWLSRLASYYCLEDKAALAREADVCG